MGQSLLLSTGCTPKTLLERARLTPDRNQKTLQCMFMIKSPWIKKPRVEAKKADSGRHCMPRDRIAALKGIARSR